MELKDKIKKMRENRNLSKSELARIIGVSPAYITKLENGDKKNPSLEIKVKLAKALNTTVSELIGLNDAFAGPGMLISEGNLSILEEKAMFTEDEIIQMLLDNYNDDIFNRKYDTEKVTLKQIEELKPIIRGIVQMALREDTKSK